MPVLNGSTAADQSLSRSFIFLPRIVSRANLSVLGGLLLAVRYTRRDETRTY